MAFSRRTLVAGAAGSPIAALLAACGANQQTAAPSSISSPASGAATAFPATSHMAKIMQRGKLIAGVKQDQPLFGMLNPRTNAIEGFDVDVVKEITKALFNTKDDPFPSKLELRGVTSAQRIPLLQEAAVDIIAATMTVTDERKQQIDFSDTYYMAGQSLLVKKESTITKIQDLDKADKTVCSATGSTSEQNITKFAPAAQKLLFAGYAECLTAIQQGRADALSTDDIILAGYLDTDPTLKMVGGQFTQEPYGLGIAKASTGFQEFVNNELRKMKTDGRWKAIYTKWLGMTGPTPEPPK
ncbi:MAG: ABC transporter, substrate-binding protein (cluster 3, basic aa/glutamine/opines) [uncultured Chloroflexi bacterium]|uniref:ABC transporter, substrate-binding protein (Cluster 3, basic aa/glutamine/opines) n=1 Tax=uncultured Chloroflexota bacterium TaxID=166587 RepID=A0A6J4J0M3_9CHLR|nr:MAG: ABC transporter, substrate-binding protein (cluster 3, basic aa/glutamine/opines) [uncultured Chloroflexota bacterium]